MDLEGAIIGQYRIIEQIGRGRMSTVYKAYQPNLDRHVAVKVLAPDLAETEGFITRFEREAKAVARLRHRNILTVFDYGRQGDVFYLVTEYVSRGTLRGYLGWPQDLTYAASIIFQVGDALAHAHKRGMIHRDVKPGNILMADKDWPLLSDFGLVKMMEDGPQLTASGASVGTPQYMSPEQAQGLAVDRRSDIYCLGVVLYEAVTGQPPFSTDSPVAVILRHINEPLTPPRALRPDLPQEMDHVICKALAKSPADRYQRMEGFLADLQEACPLPVNGTVAYRGNAQAGSQGPPPASGVAPTPVINPHLPRQRPFSCVGVTISVLLLLTLILAFWLVRTSKTLSIPTSLITDTIATVSSLSTSLGTGPSSAAPSPTVTPSPSPAVAPSPSPAVTPSPSPAVAPSPSPAVTPSPSPTIVPAVPTPLKIETQVWEADGAEMVFVPAGEFIMGSEELGDDERPARRVHLDDFWMDR